MSDLEHRPLPEGYKKVKVPLVGQNGNSFAIMGRISQAIRRSGQSQDFIDAYIEESQAGDWDALLRVAMKWSDEPDDGDFEED